MADEGYFSGYPGGGWGAAATGVGAGADIYSFIRQEQQRQALQKIYDILANPGKLANYVNKFNQPMSGAAVSAVNRDLGANWAVQTGGAPGGAMNQYTADAFAKLETQRQETATQAALRALMGATGSIPQAPAMGNLNNILRSLFVLRQLRGGQPQDGTPPGIASFPTPGGPGYGGGSETFREQGPFPRPTTADEMAGAV